MKEKQAKMRIYDDMANRYPDVIKAVDNLGQSLRGAGPLDEKTSHLIQLAAAASAGSEGSVHSHTKRAKKAGATSGEIYHSLLLCISTIGFPKAMAAISWARDMLDSE